MVKRLSEIQKDFMCIDCKHFAQGEGCSFCDNPKQTIEDYKEYVYYDFGCSLKEKGLHQTRVESMEKLKQNSNV